MEKQTNTNNPIEQASAKHSDGQATAKKFNAFIFDLDGTLLDTVPDLTLLTNSVLRDLGYPEHTQEEILSFVGAGVRRLMYLALPPDVSEETRDEAMGLWSKNFYNYSDHTFPYKGVEELLHKLRDKGCKLGIVSNKLQSGVDDIINKKLPGMFGVKFGESERTPRKPDPTGIKIAMNELGATPEHTIYIGDSPSDITAGRAAGCATAAALWGYHKKGDFAAEDAVPDFYVEHPIDLLSLA